MSDSVYSIQHRETGVRLLKPGGFVFVTPHLAEAAVVFLEKKYSLDKWAIVETQVDLETAIPEPVHYLWSQRDPHWADVILGTGTKTIGGYGCLLTCVAMIASRLTGIYSTPPGANERLKTVGGFVGRNSPTGSLLRFAAVYEAWPELEGRGLRRYTDVPAQLGLLHDQLDVGALACVQVDFDPGDEERADPDLDEHWVLAIRHEGDIIRIIDPWGLPAREHWLPPAYCRAGHQWAPERAVYAYSIYGRRAEG